MQKITEFLARFNLFVPIGSVVAKAACEAVFEVTGVVINERDIRYSNGSVYIEGQSAIRTAIRIDETAILEKMNAKLSSHSVKVSSLR